jgi:ketopantoate hydroxymethyltransferase
MADVVQRGMTTPAPTPLAGHIGLAPQKWRALFLKEEGFHGRPEADLYP